MHCEVTSMNFKELLLRAQAGDQRAQEKLLSLYQPLLMKESVVNGFFDEDVYQELFDKHKYIIYGYKIAIDSLCARPLKSRGAGLGPVTEGILALHTLWRRHRDAGRSHGLYVLAGAAVCLLAVFLLIAWCCAGGRNLLRAAVRKNTSTCRGCEKLLLEPSGTEGTFRTLFLRPYTPASFGNCSRSCQSGARGQRNILYEK